MRLQYLLNLSAIFLRGVTTKIRTTGVDEGHSAHVETGANYASLGIQSHIALAAQIKVSIIA